MHQIRNLFLNILSMIISVTVVPYIITKLWSKPYDLPHIVIICVCLFILSLILTFFSGDDDVYYKLPPSNILTIIYFGIQALCGNIKMIKTVDYKFFCRYSSGRIYVYEFEAFCYAKIFAMDYVDSTYTSSVIREKIYSRLEVPLAHKHKYKNFKSWSGALDEQSKRISTIKNIID